MKSSILPLAFVVLAVLQSHAKPQETLTGRVVGVHDGDTITVLDSSRTQHKVRLYGIDAPESGQAFGAKSKQALSDIVFREDVSVLVQDADRYGRTVGDVFRRS